MSLERTKFCTASQHALFAQPTISALVCLLVVLSLIGCGGSGGGSTTAVPNPTAVGWTKFRGNPRNTGRGLGPSAIGVFKQTLLGPGGPGAYPVLSNNTVYYLDLFNGVVHANDPVTGTEKWSFTAPGRVDAAPGVDSLGSSYFPSHDGNLYAVDATGHERWHALIASGPGFNLSSPAIASSGTLYVGSRDGGVYAFECATGTMKWKLQTGDMIPCSPSIGSDGTVYIGSDDGNLYAIDPTTGNPKWTFPTGGPVSAPPAIGDDGTIYIGSVAGNLYAISSSGLERWHYATGDGMGPDQAVGIGVDGTIFFMDHDATNSYALALDGQTGAQKWRVKVDLFFQVHSSVNMSAPAIATDGTIFVTARSGLYALDPVTGATKWFYADDFKGDPVLSSDGTLFAPTSSGIVEFQ